MPWTDRDLVLRRVVAFVIDAFVVAGAVAIVVTRLARPRRWRPLATAILAGTVGIPYHVLLEGTFGRTVGKGVAGIWVVSEDGDRCTYASATVRTILRFVDWLPIAYLVGLIAMALTERDQRLGDLVAGTVVVGDTLPDRLRE